MILYAKMRGARWLAAATSVVCVWVVLNSVVYFDGGPTPRFLLEKGRLVRSPLWITAFYFHVVGASTCLLVGLPLMFPGWTKRHPSWHRRLGYVYINAVLWVAAPAGLILAVSAKGGWWGTVGFTLAGAWWWLTTWTGYRTIIRRDLTAHIRAMIRSYALALSAPSFRIFQALLYGCGLDDRTNYIVSLWLSILSSVWLAEWAIDRRKSREPLYSSNRYQLNVGDVG